MVVGFDHIKLYASIFSLFAILCLGLSSCGNDDDDEKNNQGESTIVDGVNVVKGRKLVEMAITYPRVNWGHVDTTIVDTMFFKIKYDSKGRMNKIFRNNLGDYYDKKIEEDFLEIAEIDYDLRVFTIYDWDYNYANWQHEYHPYSFGFALNENGYISLLGNNVLKYDSNGCLESVDSPNGLSILSFNQDNYLKAAINSTVQGGMKLLYATFGDVNNKGELYVCLGSNSSGDGVFYEFGWAYRNLIGLIAYQSGLLGKVTKSFLHFKDQKEASMFLDWSGNNFYYKLYYKFE